MQRDEGIRQEHRHGARRDRAPEAQRRILHMEDDIRPVAVTPPQRTEIGEGPPVEELDRRIRTDLLKGGGEPLRIIGDAAHFVTRRGHYKNNVQYTPPSDRQTSPWCNAEPLRSCKVRPFTQG